MIAYFFSNARLLFLNSSIDQVSPLFLNFELPVTHLMVMLCIMQPHPAPDNPLIYTEQQRLRRKNSSNISKTTANYPNGSARSKQYVFTSFVCFVPDFAGAGARKKKLSKNGRFHGNGPYCKVLTEN